MRETKGKKRGREITLGRGDQRDTVWGVQVRSTGAGGEGRGGQARMRRGNVRKEPLGLSIPLHHCLHSQHSGNISRLM